MFAQTADGIANKEAEEFYAREKISFGYFHSELLYL